MLTKQACCKQYQIRHKRHIGLPSPRLQMQQKLMPNAVGFVTCSVQQPFHYALPDPLPDFSRKTKCWDEWEERVWRSHCGSWEGGAAVHSSLALMPDLAFPSLFYQIVKPPAHSSLVDNNDITVIIFIH